MPLYKHTLTIMLFLNKATSYLVSGVLGCVLLWYILFLIRNIKYLKFSFTNNAFFLPVLPLVGTVYMGLFTGDPPNVLSTMRLLKKKFGFPCNLWMGHHYFLVNSDAEEIKIIANNPECIGKADYIYEYFKVLTRNSLIFVPNGEWKVRRKHFAKSYRPNMLKTYHQTFYNQSCELLEVLKNQGYQDNLFDLGTKYAFKNFFLTSAGMEEGKIDNDKMMQFGHLLNKSQELLSSQILDPVTPLSIWLRYFPNGQTFVRAVKSCRIIIADIVKQKIIERANIEEYTENLNEMPLMDLMLNNNGVQLSDDAIYEEMILFAGAATETTGNAFAYSFICLGLHPEIQENLYNEVMAVIGDNSITNDYLSDLKYTEAVIMETMRLFPALPFLGRCCNVDVNLGTKIIPKGTNYVIDVFHLQRDPKYWENPLKFDPTRFLPGKVEKIQPYSYMAFAAGPRDCIGKAQAMMVMKTTIANVIRNFKITCSLKSLENLRLSSCLTITPIDPVSCQFIPRQDY